MGQRHWKITRIPGQEYVTWYDQYIHKHPIQENIWVHTAPEFNPPQHQATSVKKDKTGEFLCGCSIENAFPTSICKQNDAVSSAA